jgi:hypothetical protein
MKVPLNMVVQQSDYRWLSTGVRHWRGPVRMLRVGMRSLVAKARKKKLIGLGPALMAELMLGVRDAGVTVELGTRLVDLVTDNDRVVGARLESGGVQRTMLARCGVILACGGFDNNDDMRGEYQRRPSSAQWTLGAPTNTGDGIRAALRVDAAISYMDDAWWAPSIPLPKGPWFALAERSLPRSLMVNASGQRFMNESLPYVEAAHAMFGGKYGRGEGPAENIPAWLIFDQTYRDRYLFAGVPARRPIPRSWIESGAIVRAGSIAELAAEIGVPGDALSATITRFNSHARDVGQADTTTTTATAPTSPTPASENSRRVRSMPRRWCPETWAPRAASTRTLARERCAPTLRSSTGSTQRVIPARRSWVIPMPVQVQLSVPQWFSDIWPRSMRSDDPMTVVNSTPKPGIMVWQIAVGRVPLRA